MLKIFKSNRQLAIEEAVHVLEEIEPESFSLEWLENCWDNFIEENPKCAPYWEDYYSTITNAFKVEID